MTLGLWRPVDLTADRGGSLGARGVTSLIGLVAQGLVRLAVSVVVGRWAGKAVLGVVAAGMAGAQFLILLWPTTCGQAASRFLARARGRDAPLELAAAADHLGRRFLLATLVLSLVSMPISLARGTDLSGALCVAAFLWGVAGQQFTRGVHYGVGAVSRVVVLDVTFSLMGLLGVVVALAAGVRSLTLLVPLAVAYIALTVACWPWGAARQRADRDLRREIDHFVLFGSLGTVASAGLVQLSVLVSGHLGANEAGQYAAASNLAVPLTLMSGALSLVLYPSMAEAFGRGDTDTVRRQLDVGVRGLVFVLVPICAAVALLAPDVVHLVYGPEFVGSGTILAILLLAISLSMIAVPCVNAMTSTGRRGIVVIALASLVGLVVAATVWTVTLSSWGVYGVAVGYTVGVATTAGFAVVRTWSAWRMSWARPMVALLVAGLVVAGLIVVLGAWPVLARAGSAAAIVSLWVVLMGPERRLWTAAIARRGRR